VNYIKVESGAKPNV